MKLTRAGISSITEVVPEIFQIRLEAPEISASARPGQFIMVRCGEGTFLPRPFSIYLAGEGQIGLLFRVVGRGTLWLSRRQRGELLEIFGPLGNGFDISAGAANLLLVAGGMGIAPLNFLAMAAASWRKKVTLLYGARSCRALVPVAVPQSFYDQGLYPSNIHVVCATDDGSEGFKGLATDLIPQYLAGADQIFACGPASMYRAMSKMPELEGKPVQISLEAVMGCGMGVCYGCTIKTRSGARQVCRDGPVFNLREIEWGEMTGG